MESFSEVVPGKDIPIPSPSPSFHQKRYTVNSNYGGLGSLASASGVGLGLPSFSSFGNPASSVGQPGVGLDLNPVDPAYRMAFASNTPSLTQTNFFARELEALEDLIQAGSVSSGVALSIDNPSSFQGDASSVGGQHALSGDFQGIPLEVTEIGNLQGDPFSGNPHILPGDILSLTPGDLQGLQGASLGVGGGLHGDFGALIGTDLLGNTGTLQGASGGLGESFLGSSGLDGLNLGSGDFYGLQSDSFGAPSSLANTGGLQGGAGGLDGLHGDSFGVPLSLANTGGLQGGAGSLDGLQGGSFGVSLPLGNTEGLQGGTAGSDVLQSSSFGAPLPLGNTGGVQGGAIGSDGVQGVSLTLGNNGGLVSGSAGLDTLQGGSLGVPLTLESTGNLQIESVALGDLHNYVSDLQANTAGLAATQLNSGGSVGVPLPAGGLGGADLSVLSTVDPPVTTGAFGISNVHSGDLGNVGVSLADAVQVDQFSANPTDVPGTFTASSFDAASLDSLGQLLSDNVDDVTDPGQSLGSFLMDLNGKNGMMVLPASNLDALQTGQLSVAAAANASLLTNFDISAEVNNDGLLDFDIDFNIQDANDIVVAPSLATILASTAGGDITASESGDSLFLSISSNISSLPSTTPITSSTTTTTTTTTPGPPRLASVLPDLLFAKGQFFGTLLGGLVDIGSTIITAITETDWLSPPPPRSYK